LEEKPDATLVLDFLSDGANTQQGYLDNLALSGGTASVPEPGTFVLLGSGVIALAGLSWRCHRRK